METIGIKGKKCMEYTKFMEELAGGKIYEQKLPVVKVHKKI